MSPRYLILLGSNIDPEKHLAQARDELGKLFDVEAFSSVYSSPPIGAPTTPHYQNQAVIVASPLPSKPVRERLRDIEDRLGRIRTPDPNSPRTIDLDLILAFDAAANACDDPPIDPDLARYHHVALPAAEICGDVLLPKGETIDALARGLGKAPDGFRRLP